jgi:hypothetical protein
MLFRLTHCYKVIVNETIQSFHELEYLMVAILYDIKLEMSGNFECGVVAYS